MRDQTCAELLQTAYTAARRAARFVVGTSTGNRLRLVLVVLILMASIWLVIYPRFSAQNSEVAGEDNDHVPVLVTERYIPAFTLIRVQGVAVRSYPRELVPPGALHSLQELLDESGRELFIANVAIPEGQPLTRTLVGRLDQKRELSCLLPPGKVAVSIGVDRAHGAGGWVRPGDHIALFRTSAGSTRLLLSRAEVLAVDRDRLGQEAARSGANEAGPSSDVLQVVESDANILTVALNPVEAAALIEAREEGPLSVVLRAPGDDWSWAIAK